MATAAAGRATAEQARAIVAIRPADAVLSFMAFLFRGRWRNWLLGGPRAGGTRPERLDGQDVRAGDGLGAGGHGVSDVGSRPLAGQADAQAGGRDRIALRRGNVGDVDEAQPDVSALRSEERRGGK